MKRLMKKFEDIMVAITFAEAGEFDTANELMNKGNAENEDKVSQEAPETA